MPHTHKEIVNKILKEFVARYVRTETNTDFLKASIHTEDICDFLQSALHEAATAAADAMVVDEQKTKNREDVRVSFDRAWNSARSDQLSRRTQYFEETKI